MFTDSFDILRYFIVFCFYAALGSALGVWNIFHLMSGHRNALSRELAYFLLPFTSLMYLMGSAQARGVKNEFGANAN